MLHLLRHLRSLIVRGAERGASLVEYALLVALIAVVMIGAVTFLGESTFGSLEDSNDQIQTAVNRGTG